MPENDLHENDENARLDAILRSMSTEDLELETPPDGVWVGIEAATTPSLAPVVDLSARRHRRTARVIAIAAALVVVAGLAIILRPEEDPAVEVASAELVYLPDDPGFVSEGEGRFAAATLLEEGDTELIRLEDSDLPAPAEGTDLELWLIGVSDGNIEIIQTLGVVDDISDPGVYTVPADFDRGAYDTVAVDISVEPRDGDEAHSGRSLIRGPLQSA